MIGEPSQFNAQEAENLNSEQLAQNLTKFIDEQNYKAGDIEQAYLIVGGDDSIEDEDAIALAEKMNELIDKGMPLNRIGEIMAIAKESEMKEENYLKKIYSLRFDGESIKVLQRLPNMKKEGKCYIKVNERVTHILEIKNDTDPKKVEGIVSQVLDDLEKIGRQFPVQAEFHETS